MTTTSTHFSDLAREVQPPEHTASMPATPHFLQGEATVTLGDDRHEAKPGTWVHMPTGLRHSVRAKTPGSFSC